MAAVTGTSPKSSSSSSSTGSTSSAPKFIVKARLSSASSAEPFPRLHLIVRTKFEGTPSEVVSEKTIILDPRVKRTHTLTGFESFSLHVDETGQITVSDLQDESDIVFNVDTPLRFKGQCQFEGRVIVKKAPFVINKGCIKIQSLIVEAGTLDNRQGQILTEVLELTTHGDVDNTRGAIITTRMGKLNVCGALKNDGGRLCALEGNLSIESRPKPLSFPDLKARRERESACSGTITCRSGGEISSRASLKITTQRLWVDESSLVRGDTVTDITGERVHQQSILCSKRINSQGTHLFLSRMVAKEKLSLNTPVFFARYPLKAGVFTATTRQFYGVASLMATDADITTRDLFLNNPVFVQNILHARIASRFECSEQGFVVETLSLELPEGSVIRRPLKNTGSIDMLVVPVPVPPAARSSTSTTTTVALPIPPSKRPAFQIQADIQAGCKLRPEQRKGAPAATPKSIAKKPKPRISIRTETPLTIGIEPKGVDEYLRLLYMGHKPEQMGPGTYVELSAPGTTSIQCVSFDLIHGNVKGNGGLSVTSLGTLIAGRLAQLKNQPSALLTGGKLRLSAAEEIMLQGIETYGQTTIFRSSKRVDCIAGTMRTAEDALIDTPLFKFRLWSNYLPPTITRPTNYHYDLGNLALSGPAFMHVRQLTTTGITEILGSHIHCHDFAGSPPTLTAFQPWCQSRKRPGGYVINTQYGTPIPAVFSMSKTADMKLPVYTVTGFLSAPGMMLRDIRDGTLGFTSTSIYLPPSRPFVPIKPLLDSLTPSPRYVLPKPDEPNTSATVFRCLFPTMFSFKLPPPVLLMEDGTLQKNEKRYGFMMPPEMEAELLVRTLMTEFHRGILDANTTMPDKMLHQLLVNANELRETLGTSITPTPTPLAVPPWYSTSGKPVLVYRVTDFEGSPKLSPYIVFPASWDNPRLRDWAGGLFSLGDIHLQGADRKASTLRSTAHIDAKGKVRCQDFREVMIERRLHIEHRTVTDSHQSRSGMFGRKKTHSTSSTVTIVTPQAGGTLTANRVEVDNIGHFRSTGATITAGPAGFTADNIEHITEQGVIESRVVTHVMGKNVEHLLEYTIHPSRLTSAGSVSLIADTHEYHTLVAQTKRDMVLLALHHMEFGATIVRQSMPTRRESRRHRKSVTTGYVEKGLGVTFHADGNLTVKSEGSMHSAGASLTAEGNVLSEAVRENVAKPLTLKSETHTSGKGFRGLSHYKQTTHVSRETGRVPQLAAGRTLEVTSTHGDVMMVAPILMGSHIILRAPNGQVIMKPAVFHQDISSQEKTTGLSFFGSKAIEAAMRRDFRQAAHSMLKEFPLLASIGELLKSKDTADTVTSGLKTLYHGYVAYKAFAEAKTLSEFLKGQISVSAKVRFGSSHSEHHWTEVALPWLQARQILIEAKNVRIKGTQATASELTILASQDIDLDAAEQEIRNRMVADGVSVGVSISSGVLPSLGVDMARSESRAIEYIHSHFNISGLTTLVAGDKLSLKGVYIKTRDAIISAESLHLETLQNQLTARERSMGVSTDLSVSASVGSHDRKVATEASGIHAQESLLISVREAINLIGAKLTVGNLSVLKPVQYANSRRAELYELPLPVQHALLTALNLTLTELSRRLEAFPDLHLTDIPLCLILAIYEDTLPPTLQSDKTRAWTLQMSTSEGRIKGMPPEMLAFVSNPRILQIFIQEKLEALMLTPLHSNSDCSEYAILKILAQISLTNIRLWEETGDVYQERCFFQSEPESVNTIDILYAPKPKQWSFLNSTPGFIQAKIIHATEVVDVDKGRSTRGSVNFAGLLSTLGGLLSKTSNGSTAESTLPPHVTFEAHHSNFRTESIHRSTASSNIIIKAKTPASLNRDPSLAHVQTHHEKHHYGLFAVVCNYANATQHVRQTFSQPPRMFSREPNKGDASTEPVEEPAAPAKRGSAAGEPGTSTASTSNGSATDIPAENRRTTTVSPQSYKQKVQAILAQTIKTELTVRGYKTPEKSLSTRSTRRANARDDMSDDATPLDINKKIKQETTILTRFLNGSSDAMRESLIALGRREIFHSGLSSGRTAEEYILKAVHYLCGLGLEAIGGRAAHAATSSTSTASKPTSRGFGEFGLSTEALITRSIPSLRLPRADAALLGDGSARLTENTSSGTRMGVSKTTSTALTTPKPTPVSLPPAVPAFTPLYSSHARGTRSSAYNRLRDAAFPSRTTVENPPVSRYFPTDIGRQSRQSSRAFGLTFNPFERRTEYYKLDTVPVYNVLQSWDPTHYTFPRTFNYAFAADVVNPIHYAMDSRCKRPTLLERRDALNAQVTEFQKANLQMGALCGAVNWVMTTPFKLLGLATEAAELVDNSSLLAASEKHWEVLRQKSGGSVLTAITTCFVDGYTMRFHNVEQCVEQGRFFKAGFHSADICGDAAGFVIGGTGAVNTTLKLGGKVIVAGTRGAGNFGRKIIEHYGRRLGSSREMFPEVELVNRVGLKLEAAGAPTIDASLMRRMKALDEAMMSEILVGRELGLTSSRPAPYTYLYQHNGVPPYTSQAAKTSGFSAKERGRQSLLIDKFPEVVLGQGVPDKPRLISSINRVSSNTANKPFMNEKAVTEGWSLPYPVDTNLREIRVSTEIKFYRVHTNPNKLTGDFFAREKEIAPFLHDTEALRVHFGLRDVPIYITEVNVPAGARLVVGRIGPQPSFGLMENSGFQYQAVSRIPDSNFVNTILISEFRLNKRFGY